MPHPEPGITLHHRMPVGFGPFPGPRQIPAGQIRDSVNTPCRRVATVRFLSTVAALQPLLPPGFSIEGEPVVTVEMQHMTEIDWLAGRGYATFGVKLPVRYRGGEEGRGLFLTVLWENLADPIISGREELGYAKLWCELPEPRIAGGRWVYSPHWLGFGFAEMELWDLVDDDRPPPPAQDSFHYKYIPATGRPGEADAAYATMSPAANPDASVHRRLRGEGRIAFRPGRWEVLPTLHHIVSALAALPVVEWRGAGVIFGQGGKDLSDLRRLR